MKRALILLLLSVAAFAQTVGIVSTTVPYTTTPVFTAAAGIHNFTINLQGSVSVATFSSPAVGVGSLRVCQDSTGSRTFPAVVGSVGMGTIDATANTCSTQQWVWDGSILRFSGAMVTSNSSVPGGIPGIFNTTGDGTYCLNRSSGVYSWGTCPSGSTNILGVTGAFSGTSTVTITHNLNTLTPQIVLYDSAGCMLGSTTGCTPAANVNGIHTTSANAVVANLSGTATGVWSAIAVTAASGGVATPSFSSGTGTYNNNLNITITDSTTSAAICYRTDGVAPSASTAGTCDAGSTTYSSSVPISATATVLKALGTLAGQVNSVVQSATYTLQVGSISATPSAPYSGGSTTVTLASVTVGSTVHYRTDGTVASCADTAYSGPLTVSATTTITAIGCASGFVDSAAFSGVYTIGSSTSTPTFDNGTGTYNNTVAVSITEGTSGADVCYRTDGVNPAATTAGTCDGGSTTYTGSAVSITANGTNLKALGTKSGLSNSSIQSATYTLQVGTITASPTAPYSGSSTTVTLSTTTTSGVIHYRTDGTAAGCSDTTYSTPISVSTTTTITAIGCKASYANSSSFSGTYTISGGSNPITFVTACSKDNGGFNGTTFDMNSCFGSGGSRVHTAGNALILGVFFKSSTCAAAGTIAVTNTAGDTWSAVDSYTASTMGCIATYIVPSTAGSSADTIHIAITNSAFLLGAAVLEFSGLQASPIDVTGTGAFASAVTSVTSGSFTTATAHSLVVAFGEGSNTAAWSSASVGGNAMTLNGAMHTSTNTYQLGYYIASTTLSSVTANIVKGSSVNLAIVANTFKGN